MSHSLLLLALATLVLSPGPALAQHDSGGTQVATMDSIRLRSSSNRQLIDLLTRDAIDAEVPGPGDLVHVLPPRQFDTLNLQRASTLPYPNMVVGELVRRGPSQELIRAFAASEDWTQLNWLETTLSQLRSPPVDSAMTLFAQRGARDEQGYLANLYFAEAGRCWALDHLEGEFDRLPISAREKVEVVALFRKYRFYPAAEDLALAISATVGTLSDAALAALRTMYPGGPASVDGPMSAADQWRQYVLKHRRGRSASLCT